MHTNPRLFRAWSCPCDAALAYSSLALTRSGPARASTSPSSYMMPRLLSADAFPCAADFSYQNAAAPWSTPTPSPP